MYPGQSFKVSAVVVGEIFGTVAGSVFAEFLEIEHNSIITTPMLGRSLHLFFDNSAVPIVDSRSLVTINITLLSCPPGFTLALTSARCECSLLLAQLPGVTCNIQEERIVRSGLVWLAAVRNSNETAVKVLTAIYCPLNYCKIKKVSIRLDQPDMQCEHNRSGILCGGCKQGLSLILGGNQCKKCSNKYISLCLPLALSGVLLVVFIKVLDLTTSHGFINSLIFYANVVKANEHIFFPQESSNPISIFISWLNLDLGIHTCFFRGLNAYVKIWLQFVYPFFIWSITVAIIVSARYSIKVSKITGNNTVPVLATLFLLSYAKLLGIITNALSYTVLKGPGEQRLVWSADGNIDYLGTKHIPLFVAALATLFFLWLPYTVLLLLGQWLYKIRCGFINCMLIKLNPFLDAYYGPLNNSHRYWFGVLLLVRATVLLISALTVKISFSVSVLVIAVASIGVIAVLMALSHFNVDI